MRAWMNLPHAVPVLLRHIGAYAELAAQDLEGRRRHLTKQSIALAVGAIAAAFALLLIVLAVIAATWDTPNRLAAIYGLIGLFAVTALLAFAYAGRIEAGKPVLFESVRREWDKDRAIFDAIVSGHAAPADTMERPHDY